MKQLRTWNDAMNAAVVSGTSPDVVTVAKTMAAELTVYEQWAGDMWVQGTPNISKLEEMVWQQDLVTEVYVTDFCPPEIKWQAIAAEAARDGGLK
jgi:hypothetical protein